jgi:hypothetical protein
MTQKVTLGDKAYWLEWGLIAGLGAEVIRLCTLSKQPVEKVAREIG